MTKIQNGHHFGVQTPKWQIVLLYSVCNTYWSTLVSFDTRKTRKNQKVENDKNSKMAAILTYKHQNGKLY